MDIENDKLERFGNEVYNEANEKVKEILGEAEKSRQTILDNANDVSLNIAYDMIQADIKKISSKYVKIVAKAELEAKREVLYHREELSTLVFANVKAQINAFTLSDEYEEYLIENLKEALLNFDSEDEIEIFLSPKDMKFKDILITKSNYKNAIVTQKPSIKLGGLEILFKNNNVIDDRTLDSKLSAQREIFNQSVSLRI